jgi:hypothetical protein
MPKAQKFLANGGGIHKRAPPDLTTRFKRNRQVVEDLN